ncbi:putative membrane channel-forming protein YqfA (hemolysin III family) [Arthrobacter sp. GAS37]|uniref:hypothetical protein n=1 Tax=Arthrobacter sp. GAS37 TaxID=3156261 RepID=UPI003837B84B
MSNNMNAKETDPKETLAWIAFGVFLVVSGAGLALVNGLLGRVLVWLADTKVVVTEGVVWSIGVLPNGQAFGLDYGRIFILGLVVLLALGALVYVVRVRVLRRRATDDRI